ncbi:HNH endonuclease [Scytonema hofmannii PCC 7110]|uniref:HNH endonuclease n=1 Tax=Scytonema hofmannii PCC 7110 TaxID=128403 RepID=A0A139WX14_9CYAN|nr:HNH endonuclease signature motif containing protein [Scytonema hofmannii]KYC36970.1 HNH endonuclease [Scytonema hofmannii PCC 7110]
MSVTYIPAALRRLVEERARYRCEYCLLPQNISFFPHEIDHVIPEKHGGKTDAGNLAFTCWRCNRYKGTDLGSFDPQTGEFSFLFNPRIQQWTEHFAFEKLKIVGLTPEGRTTAKLLQYNNDERLAERERLGEHPS